MRSKKIFLKKEKNKGLTLTELIIGLAIVGLLAVLMVLGLKPKVQLDKAKDSKRKTDLKRIQTALEDYYNDHNCYPTSLVCNDPFNPYLEKIPCDPDGGSYSYEVSGDCPQYYRIYAKLKYASDPDIKKVGCESGCGATGQYNYGLSSSNVSLETGMASSPTSTPAPPPPTSPPLGQYYGCFSGICQPLPGPICSPNYQSKNCYGACSNPANECK